ncbi:MAG: hypothetical protein JO329_02260 [Planctomycetaceae bacterium]|nr:hypothetical protein [Planctomycetaceae bacterium]MBV8264859.1 hypothetical protein [Planctomycetaceae bacterium]MBV8555425.1 hypothetical protein [Planctomycetaceae bacterium]
MSPLPRWAEGDDSRDYESAPSSSEAQVQISMIPLMLRRLSGEEHEAPFRYPRPKRNITA